MTEIYLHIVARMADYMASAATQERAEADAARAMAVTERPGAESVKMAALIEVMRAYNIYNM